MRKPNVKKAQKHLEKLKQLASTRKADAKKMSEAEVIKAIRKTREEIWEEKFATRS